MISLGFGRGGTLHVENYLGSRVNVRGLNVAASFNQHFVIVVAQVLDQLECLALGQRFASRDFHQPAAEIADLPHNLCNRKVLAASESVLAVTPYATHRATRQPHKGAGPTRVGRLALN